MKKKILLAFWVIMLNLIAFGTISASAETEGIYTYTVSNGEATITGCDESVSGEIVIPSTLGGNAVIKIDYAAFWKCTNITKVTIPNSVTSIGGCAFASCTNLTSINIPNGVISIGYSAFQDCTKLKELVIPDSVEEYGSSILKSCSSLESLTIPTTCFGDGVASRFGYIFGYDYTAYNNLIPSNATYQEYKTQYAYNKYYYYYYYIPSTLKKVTVTKSIGDYAFYKCKNIKTLVAGENVQYVGYKAFEYSGIALTYQNNALYLGRVLYDVKTEHAGSFTIKDGTYVIGKEAFYGCSSITSVRIPNSVKNIEESAFSSCYALTSIAIPDSVTNIGPSAFFYCEKLANVTIGNGVNNIGDSAFARCDVLTSITIGKGIKYIGENAFDECYDLSSVKISDVSAWCSIDFSSLTSNPLWYANNLYLNGNLVTNLSIPDGVISIGSYAFDNCESIVSVKIPDSVTSIGSNAFYGCENLTSVKISDISAWCSIDFSNSASNPLCNVGVVLHLNETPITKLDIPDSVIAISDYAFYNCNNLTSVYIPKSITSIGTSAFSGCSSLKSVCIFDLSAWCNINFANSTSNPLCNASDLYLNEIIVNNINLPEDLVEIKNYTFSGCASITSVTIPHNITHIGNSAFSECTGLLIVNYNGNEEDWNAISIGSQNTSLTNATLNCFWYVNLFDEDNEKETFISPADCVFDFTIIPEKKGHTTKIYTDKALTNDFVITTPISENIDLYFAYKINQYTHKFLDEDGRVIKEETVNYDTNILPPQNPSKERTQQYTYTFAGWNGYEDGITQKDEEMVFTAKYNETINQYTYKFLDEDESVLKEEIVDYGTIITPPTNPIKTEYYLFDYWQGYTEGITVTDDITFTAVYKYNDYNIIAEGLSDVITVTYNDKFSINPQAKDGYTFIGYFTEKDGAGIQITNEKGGSLNVYNVVGDLKVYPYFYSNYMNMVELQGVETAMPGDTITQKAIFATDKNATYFIATVKYPKYLNFNNIKGIDFKEANKDSEKVVGDYKYADITCVFDYEGNFAKINTNYIPFEIEFDVNTDATLGVCEISIENVMLIGDDTFDITDIKNRTLTILPKLAESIEIVGNDEIDATEQFSAVVSPDYTTDKSVVWSVNDETVAAISQDGTVTPVKNGTVTITATAKDGSKVFATKSVNVIAYAKINSLDFGSGVVLTEFNPDVRKYTVYVKENATSISLTPTFSDGGVLRPNGNGIWLSGRAKDFELNDVETTITLNRENVTDMTNSVYTIEVIKFEGTKTKVSEDKKSFTITPINIENGKTVILALYNGEQFVEMQSAVYSDGVVPFTTTKQYTSAKVMVWDDLTNLKPLYDVEFVK